MRIRNRRTGIDRQEPSTVRRQARRTILAGSGALLALTAQFSAGAPVAHAASAAACAASPSTANCDGADAAADGGACLNGSFVVQSYPIVPHFDENYGRGPVAAKVELWWSPTCQTNWGRIVSTGYSGFATVFVWRQADGAHQAYSNRLESSGYWSALYSDMLYSPGPAQACADDGASWGGCGLWV